MNDINGGVVNHKELCKIIAAKLNTRNADVALFLDALVKVFTESIIKEKHFRIKGLGSFKLIAMQPRESINIANGEKIVIESFNKLHYIPDKEIKSITADTPFASNDTIAYSESSLVDEDSEDFSLDRFDSQAQEIIEILEELGENPIETSPEGEDDTITSEDPNDNNPIKSQENIPNNEQHPDFEKEKKKEIITINNDNMIKEDSFELNENGPEVDIQEEEEPQKKHVLRDILIALGVAIVVVVVCFIFLRQQITSFISSFNTPPTQIVQPKPNQQTPNLTTTPDENPPTENKLKNQTNKNKPASLNIKYDKFITHEKVLSGTWLAKLSRKYYGETDLWVFIYDANKNILPNPHFIPIGTIVKIPELPNNLKNISDPQTQHIISELLKKYK